MNEVPNIERLYAFVIDVEELLKIRDTHFRTLRSIEAENAVMIRSSLPAFEQEKNSALEHNKQMAMQADEAFRVSTGMLQTLTGKTDINDIRKLLMASKAVLKRINEAQFNVEDATFLTAMVKDSDPDEYKSNVKATSEASNTDYADAYAYAQMLVPASYSPNKPIPNITLAQ